MPRVLRFCVALVGAAIALYLVFHLASRAVLDVVGLIVVIPTDDGWERTFALLGACVGAVPFALAYARGASSLERLWLFVVAVHLLSYLLVGVYFHLAEFRDGSWTLLATPVNEAAYYAMGYGLFVVALSLAYVAVYRDGSVMATDRSST